jgi:hypothetical protein
MKTQPDDLIHSFSDGSRQPGNWNGLTKLEYFACLAMQGIISSYPNFGDLNEEFAARVAVTHAKALIDELKKEQK